MMKKVLFINHTNDVFGAESVLLEVLRNCQLPPSHVLVVEPNYRKESKFASRVQQLGYEVVRLNYKNIGKNWWRTLLVLLYNIPACLRLCRKVRKEGFTTIYSNTSVNCLGAVVARWCRIQHLWHIHEPVEKEHGFTYGVDRLYNIFFSYQTIHIFFAAYKQRAQWLERFPIIADISEVLYNPISEFQHETHPHDTCCFGYLGSRAKRKNIPALIQAFAKLYTSKPNVRLLLSINDGEDDARINQMIVDFHLESVIEQRAIRQLSDFYNRIDVLVLPSFSETWGMVVLEAMQQGIATIITTHTGLDELLEHKKHTLYIDPYDTESIYQAMLCMTDESYRKKIGVTGQSLLLAYQFNVAFQNTIQKYLYD